MVVEHSVDESSQQLLAGQSFAEHPGGPGGQLLEQGAATWRTSTSGKIEDKFNKLQ